MTEPTNPLYLTNCVLQAAQQADAEPSNAILARCLFAVMIAGGSWGEDGEPPADVARRYFAAEQISRRGFGLGKVYRICERVFAEIGDDFRDSAHIVPGGNWLDTDQHDYSFSPFDNVVNSLMHLLGIMDDSWDWEGHDSRVVNAVAAAWRSDE